MKKLLLFSFASIIASCNTPSPKAPTGEEANSPQEYGNFTIRVIDSCEYIEYDNGWADQRVYSLCHKGNCKFCEIRRQLIIKNDSKK